MMAEIMLVVAGIRPMGMPLQEPEVICMPFVSCSPAQKFMKFASSLGINVSVFASASTLDLGFGSKHHIRRQGKGEQN